jgi:hypothetical protein
MRPNAIRPPKGIGDHFGAAVEGEFRFIAELVTKIVRSHQESSLEVLGIFREDRLLASEDAVKRISQKCEIEIVKCWSCYRLKIKVNLAKMPSLWYPVLQDFVEEK